MKPFPFPVRRENGVVFIDRAVDEAFRTALRNGVPASLRSKMDEALAATPGKGARAHSVRYFGEELLAITERFAPLMFQLNKTLTEAFNLPGLYDWMDLTGYGNDYRMIKVMAAWAELIRPLPDGELAGCVSTFQNQCLRITRMDRPDCSTNATLVALLATSPAFAANELISGEKFERKLSLVARAHGIRCHWNPNGESMLTDMNPAHVQDLPNGKSND